MERDGTRTGRPGIVCGDQGQPRDETEYGGQHGDEAANA